MMTTRQTGMKAILMTEPFNLMSHVMKLTHPAQGSLVGQGGRPTTDHSKMMVTLGGMEVVGLVVGMELVMGQQIWIITKP